MTGPLPIVIPAAPGSPWLADCVRSARADGAETIYVVSEEPGPSGTEHVPIHHSFGFAVRANRGLEWAAKSGPRALLLNDDTAVEPGTLGALTAALDRHPIAGAVVMDWDGGRIQQAGIVIGRSGRVRAQQVEPTEAVAPVPAVGGTAMALDLARWQALGRFDEAFRFYMEDVDLCRRAGGAVVVRDARVRHRGGGTRSHHSADAAYHLGRSHTLLARRMGGRGRLLTVAGFGAAWTVREVGLGGLGKFAQGTLEGLFA